MANRTDLEQRLERLEGRLERLLDVLEQPPTPFAKASSTAQTALTNLYGRAEVQERLGELVLRLGEPSTMEALTRIGILLPQLEYALQFAAGGPELLEEGLEMVRKQMEDRGLGHAEVQTRMLAASDAIETLSQPVVLRSLGALAAGVPHLSPMLDAIASAAHDLSEAEGEAALRTRLKESLTVLAHDETLGSLTRIAALAPQLEYAVTFLAAGPELLEEGLDMVRNTAATHRIEPQEMKRRVGTAMDALAALSKVEVLEALRDVDVSGLAEIARSVSNPEITGALHQLLGLAPDLVRPLASLPVQPNTLDLLRTVNQAVESASSQSPSKLGMFGLLSAIRDPNVQRALGFGVEVARQVGLHLAEEGRQAQLTSGK